MSEVPQYIYEELAGDIAGIGESLNSGAYEAIDAYVHLVDLYWSYLPELDEGGSNRLLTFALEYARQNSITADQARDILTDYVRPSAEDKERVIDEIIGSLQWLQVGRLAVGDTEGTAMYGAELDVVVPEDYTPKDLRAPKPKKELNFSEFVSENGTLSGRSLLDLAKKKPMEAARILDDFSLSLPPERQPSDLAELLAIVEWSSEDEELEFLDRVDLSHEVAE